ncbi:MAG: nicotinamide-nucleotide amidase [Methylomicrobium sp.]
MSTQTIELSQKVGARLQAYGWMLATAESCTGGGIAEAITAIAGSSSWFDRGFVTYSNAAKIQMLGVAPDTIERFGAVSTETARAMSAGALSNSQADWAIAVTGIAGPSGGTMIKPVGTVFLSWQKRGGEAKVTRRQFAGDRHHIRLSTIEFALATWLELTE